MSIDGPQKAKGRESPNLSVIFTFIATITILLIVLTTTYRDSLEKTFFKTPIATPSSVVDVDMPATLKNSLSPAVQTMDQYYQYINNAKNSDDLGKAWTLMTINLKCNPNDRCNFVQYQNYWWQLKVQYKLYDCGSNTIDTELIYYSRKADGPLSSAQTEYIRYQLIEEAGQLMLDSGEPIEAIGANCELAVSAP